MRRLLILALLLLATPAMAHSLRVFAKAEGAQVSGYGFFVGGGRPQGVDWVARMADQTLASGQTDAEGRFAFAAPPQVSADIVVTLNTGEGHMASATLPPTRFATALPPDAPAPTTAPPAATSADTAPVPASTAPSPDQVESAVARQIAPLLERIEQMDARLRLTDIVSGVCFILGLAGVALWARGRRP